MVSSLNAAFPPTAVGTDPPPLLRCSLAFITPSSIIASMSITAASRAVLRVMVEKRSPALRRMRTLAASVAEEPFRLACLDAGVVWASEMLFKRSVNFIKCLRDPGRSDTAPNQLLR